MKYRKYSREEKEALTAEWVETGTNRTAFARTHGITIQTFMNWTKGNKAEEQRFVQLAEPCKCKEDGQIIIEKGNMRILLPLQTESEVLCRIFRSMEGI
jgi:transposase-like protein